MFLLFFIIFVFSGIKIFWKIKNYNFPRFFFLLFYYCYLLFFIMITSNGGIDEK